MSAVADDRFLQVEIERSLLVDLPTEILDDESILPSERHYIEDEYTTMTLSACAVAESGGIRSELRSSGHNGLVPDESSSSFRDDKGVPKALRPVMRAELETLRPALSGLGFSTAEIDSAFRGAFSNYRFTSWID